MRIGLVAVIALGVTMSVNGIAGQPADSTNKTNSATLKTGAAAATNSATITFMGLVSSTRLDNGTLYAASVAKMGELRKTYSIVLDEKGQQLAMSLREGKLIGAVRVTGHLTGKKANNQEQIVIADFAQE